MLLSWPDDIDDQSSGNYEYDEIGNLIGDAQEQIDSIEWTVYGKIKRITRTTGSLKPNLEFEYSPDGHRVCKIVKPKVGTHLWTYTYYVRDAQGNIMATYDRTLEAIFDPEQPSYTNINAELVALNGAVAFKNFIQTLHPQISSTNFIDSLKQMVLDSSYELQFLNHFNPTYYLQNNFTYFNTVYTSFDNDKLITGFYTLYGESSFCNSLYTYDAIGFVQYFVDQDASAYLIALNGYNSGTLYQMYLDAGGTPSTPPPGPGFMDTYIRGVWSNTQIADWITNNGGFSLHYSILQQYMSSLDIRTLLASYSNLTTAITAQYTITAIIDVMVAYSGTYVWSLLHPSVSAGTLLGEVFSHEPSNAYDVLVQYFWSLVAFVQTDNYYYSKTEYFDSIRTIYGQYTYDILVGKFITLSNQFKDLFVLSEWHLYGSSRLGIQKPNALNSYAQLTSATAGKGRELVHIEFSGSWSEYEVNYADTHYTTVTTYQMSYEYYSLTRGEKNYELVNHLGNVMVVVSDKKLKTCAGDTVNYYTADVLQANDYYAFHSTMSGRTYTASNSSYRFGGSNGQEKDDEIFTGAYSAEYWEYDSRSGRRWNVDLVTKPWESPYETFSNNPIFFIDPLGNESSNNEGPNKGLSSDPLKNAELKTGGDPTDPRDILKGFKPHDRYERKFVKWVRREEKKGTKFSERMEAEDIFAGLNADKKMTIKHLNRVVKSNSTLTGWSFQLSSPNRVIAGDHKSGSGSDSKVANVFVNSGTLYLDFNMFGAPDRLQILNTATGEVIFDTKSLPEANASGQVKWKKGTGQFINFNLGAGNTQITVLINGGATTNPDTVFKYKIILNPGQPLTHAVVDGTGK